MVDVLIIGAGPAGISAGLYAKRAGKDVLILYNGESNLEKAHKIENYYGFENGITGSKLYSDGIKQAKNLGIEVKKEEVLHIEKEENFLVRTENSEYTSKTLILATGNKKLRPDIDGIVEFEGKGVSYCAICDGFFYRKKNVVVIGNGKFAINEANDLKNVANSVKILTNGEKMQVDTDEYEVINKTIAKISGEEKVSKIRFEDGSTIDVDGVFVALGEASRNRLC